MKRIVTRNYRYTDGTRYLVNENVTNIDNHAMMVEISKIEQDILAEILNDNKEYNLTKGNAEFSIPGNMYYDEKTDSYLYMKGIDDLLYEKIVVKCETEILVKPFIDVDFDDRSLEISLFTNPKTETVDKKPNIFMTTTRYNYRDSKLFGHTKHECVYRDSLSDIMCDIKTIYKYDIDPESKKLHLIEVITETRHHTHKDIESVNLV